MGNGRDVAPKKKEEIVPDFVGIGVQRAATTWLFNCLREHPDIYVVPEKELHFFDEKFSLGIDWYMDQFKEGNGCVSGEITPDYIYNKEAIPRIHSFFPEIKLIVSLRNPVDRAYSAYRLLRTGVYQGLKFEEAFWKRSYIKEAGFYYRHLSKVFSLFSKEQVMIFLYEDILHEPGTIVRSLYSFLKVDSSYVPSSLEMNYNAIHFSSLQSFLKRVIGEEGLQTLKESGPGKVARTFLSKVFSQKTLPLSREDYLKCIEIYREDILKLQDLINRDLSCWLSY